jgi:drug/metabolite transporter (DMT)-like permease
MMRIVLLSFVQSALSVGGIGLLHTALHGKDQNMIGTVMSLLSLRGMAGSLMLFLGFLVMSHMLSLTKVSVFIPLNTATTFLLTIGFGLISGSDRPSLSLIIGMGLVLCGIALITAQRS